MLAGRGRRRAGGTMTEAEKRLVVVDDYPLGVGGGFGRKPVPMEEKGIGHAGFVDPGGSRGAAH